ncbi:T9SS type B sorting domain-containing protein [bacterium]|nr:T9SS type B sorting domain-containing protein [bacterium]
MSRVYQFTVWLLLAYLSIASVSAQKQKQNWYFGRAAAITFRNDTPQVLTDNPLTTYTTSAITANDPATGELLFYSNGEELRDANHNAIARLIDNPQYIRDMVVLPHPSKSNIYYLYIIISNGGLAAQTTLNFFTITMDNRSVKSCEGPFSMTKGYAHKITAVKNCGNGGYWLFMDYNYKKVVSYSLGHSGWPVPHDTFDLNENMQGLGDLVSNSDGTLLALSNYNVKPEATQVIVLKVDKLCGTLSDYRKFNYTKGEYPFGLAFSNNSRFLYISYSVGTSQLAQYDIENEEGYIVSISDQNYNELQMGPDGKIYVSTNDDNRPGPRIDVIEKPDEKGTACGFRTNALNLGKDRTSNFCFPNFIQDYSTEGCKTFAPEFVVDSACVGGTITVRQINDYKPAGSFEWQVNEKKVTENPPSFTSDSMQQVVFDYIWQTCNRPDTIRLIGGFADSVDFVMDRDTILCGGEALTIGPPIDSALRYHWSQTNVYSNKLNITESGQYCLTASNKGCAITKCVQVKFRPQPRDLGDSADYPCDTLSASLVRAGGNADFPQYRWYPFPQDTSQWYVVEAEGPGLFYVVGDRYRCNYTGAQYLTTNCPSVIYFPNAFTPGNDKLNNYFGAYGYNVSKYHLQVFNRWGELLFESNNLNERWDGTFKEQLCDPGIYYYTCSYATQDQGYLRLGNTSGKVVLLR